MTRVLLRLGRVSNVPTIWTNCLAGVILAGGKPNGAAFIVLCFAMSMFYIGGMFLNDAFDVKFDRQYRPERPIPAGEITRQAVFAIGFGLLAGALILLILPPLFRGIIPGELLVWGVTLAGLIVYYDLRHKHDPLSPLIMALCRAMVYFGAAAAIASALTGRVIAGAAMIVAYLIGLTYVAKQENLSEVKNLWPLLFFAMPFIYAAPLLTTVGVVLYVTLIAWVAYSLSHLISKKKNIPRAVVTLIAGISLLDGVLIALAGEPSLGFLAIIGFALTLLFQRYIPGT